MSRSSCPTGPYVAPSAVVAASAVLAQGVRIWDHTHVECGASVGAETVVGRGVTIGTGVRVGQRCKVQNAALVYGPAVLGDGVFVGPGAVLTNDHLPRAVNADDTVKHAADWDPVGVVVEHGASIGARAVCVAPVRIGRWAMIAAGAVVTRDVPDHALVAGVPARRQGWVGRAGVALAHVADDELVCPRSGDRFRLASDGASIAALR